MTEPRPSQETFIIRLWKQSPQTLTWRGQAQNVRTGQQVAIHSLMDLLSCFEDFFPEEDNEEDAPALPAQKPGLNEKGRTSRRFSQKILPLFGQPSLTGRFAAGRFQKQKKERET